MSGLKLGGPTKTKRVNRARNASGHTVMKRLRTPFAAACIAIAAAPAAFAASTPAILITKANAVPSCVTPAHLMEMVKKRNPSLLPKLSDIASAYKKHGDELHVRWDYAFYQMLVETNYLKFLAPGGKRGDVSPGQNNFAGLGATGHRAPGESFASVDAGVLAHLQHVRLYAGDPVENPVAERTKLVTDLILPWAQSLKRPVTYTDLTHRWAPSGHSYSDAIEGTADFYRKAFCTGAAADEAVAEPDAEVVAEAAPAVTSKAKAKVKVVLIKPPVVEASKAATAEPAVETPAADVAAAEAPAAEDSPSLAGPALTKVAKAAAAAEPEAVDEATPVADEPAAPAEPVKPIATAVAKPKAAAAVPVIDEADAVAPKMTPKVKVALAKLPVDATVTALSPDADLAAATAKLDGLDTAPTEAAPVAAEPDAGRTETATADEGDGGATEVTQEQVKSAKVATAKAAKKMVAQADTAEVPVVKAKAVAAEDAAVATADSPVEDAAGNTQLASLTVPANPAPSKNCKVFTASYGGGMSLLIQSPDGDRTKFTALTVNEAKADAQAKAFINVYAKGGQKIASFGTQNEALTKAFELCPEG